MRSNLGLASVSVLAAVVAGCATAEASPTPEQRAACEDMLARMGEGATHSHGSDKSGAVNTMGMTHDQCRRMLGR